MVVQQLAELTFADRMIAGSVARTVAQTILHPLDTLRTRAQAAKRGDLPSASAAGAAPAEPLARTLGRGLLPQVLLAGPAGAIQFATLEWARDALAPYVPSPVLANLLAGAAGAIAASVVRVPQENLKQPVQAGRYPNALSCLQALSAEGPGRFYRGLQSTLLRDVPWNALSFAFFKLFAALAAATVGFAGPAADVAFGSLGGAIAAVLLTPFDVAKTRLMTQTREEGEAGALPYSGTFATITRVAREEGPGALMAGVLPRVLYLAPLASVVFSVYGWTASLLLEAKARG